MGSCSVGRALPANFRCEPNCEVHYGAPCDRLSHREGDVHEGGGQVEGPSWVEPPGALPEEYWEPVHLQSTAANSDQGHPNKPHAAM
jgi:hypothetical protein